MKLNLFGSQPLILVRDPQLPMEAATKNYVDTSLLTHANNFDLHLTPAQNVLLDNLTVAYSDINQLSGITGNVQSLLDAKFDKAGGTINGDVTINTGYTVYMSKVPATPTELVNKAYVDGLINGLDWRDSVTDINLVDDSLTTPPASPTLYDVYIVATGGVNAWAGLDGYAVQWNGTSWVQLQSRPVQVGDRFGVALTSATTVGASLTAYAKDLVQVSSVTAGVIGYTAEAKKAGTTVLVFDPDSHWFGVTFTFTDSSVWVPTNTSVNIVPGTAITLAGSTLSVNVGAGLNTLNNDINVDLYSNSGLFLTEDGVTASTTTAAKLAVQLKDSSLTIDAGGLFLSSSVVASIADKVSKTTANAISGSMNFALGSSLDINYNIVNNTQATNKLYVDTAISDLNTALTSSINTKVSKSGDTMTGPLVLSGDPTANLQAAPKQYVDNGLATKLNLTGGTLTGTLTLAADPTLPLEAATMQYVDAGDALKVSKAGDTMTGFLTLSADPTSPLHAATKQYVDAGLTTLDNTLTASISTKVSKAGDTMTGFLTLNADPTQALHAATMQYVDAGDAAVTSNLTAQINTKVSKSGDSMTGYLTLSGDPTQALHAATKQYVDNMAQGLSAKPEVRLATTVNLDATYNNGSFGVNATLTGNANGALLVDGVNPIVGDRILVRVQTAALQNGDYTVQQTGDANTPFILKRVTTVDESSEIPGSYYFVYDGATLKATGWTAVVANPITFAIGTDDINIYQFMGQGSIIAGAGLTLTGNTIDINTASPTRIVINPDSIDLATTGVTPGSYTKVVVDGYGRVTSGSNPNTLAGYGITDAQPLNANLTSLSAVASQGILIMDNTNSVVTKSITANGVGLSVTNQNGAAAGNIVINSNATDLNTPSTIVARDASGNFVANIITADLNGLAAFASQLQNPTNFSITGDVTAPAVSFNGTADVALAATLSATGVTPGTYNKLTVDAKGRVTSATAETTIAGLGVTDVYTKTEVDTIVAGLQAQIADLSAFIMSRM